MTYCNGNPDFGKLEKLFLPFIFAFCFLLRFLPYFSISLNTGILLTTPDPYYHMRRVLLMMQNFPQLPVFDYYLAYPTGGSCIWPPLFDFLAGLITYIIFLGKPTIHQAELVCSLYPIFWGIATTYLTFLISKELFGKKVGYASAFIISILPSNIIWSRFGYFDHHIAESFSILLILYSLVKKARSEIHSWLLLGLSLGIGMLLWQGLILFTGIVLLILLLQGRHKFAISFLIALLLILPFSVKTNFPDSPFSYRGLSLLHITLLSLAILILVFCILIKKSKLWIPVFITVIFILLLFLLRQKGFYGGFSYLFKTNVWLKTIHEFQTLVAPVGYYWETITAVVLFGRAYFIWPFIAIFSVFHKNYIVNKISFYLFLFFTGLMAFLSRRYTVWFSPFYSIIISYFLIWMIDFFKKTIKLNFLKWILIFSVIIVTFYPVLDFFLKIKPETNPGLDEVRSLKWLADNTPLTSYYYNPTRKPEYGIMCYWNVGHYVIYFGKRPAVGSNFGVDVPNFMVPNHFFLSSSEQEVNKIMDDFNCRYIYLTKQRVQTLKEITTYFSINPDSFIHIYYAKNEKGDIAELLKLKSPAYSTTLIRLHNFYGSGFYYEDKFYPPYRRFRLRYVSNDQDIKIFEYVTGATITGKGQPGEPVRIYLNNEINKFYFPYFDSLQIDKNGKFNITTPYPTDSSNPYHIFVCDKEYTLVVPENFIYGGDTILLR